MQNIRIERRKIGEQSDKSPLYGARVIVDDRDMTPTDEQREAALKLCALFDPPPAKKPEAKPA